MQKKMISLMIVLLLFVQLFVNEIPVYADVMTWQDLGAVGTGYAEGSGTADDPFVISEEAELAYLASQVLSGNSYEFKYFKLTENLDLSGKYWIPIGSPVNPFRGTFLGNGHTITNMAIQSTSGYAGLFSVLSSGAKVERLALTNVSVIGGESAERIGGFAGSSDGTIENCFVTGVITLLNSTGYNVGGISGEIGPTGIIKNSYSNCTINGTNGTGGIVGYCGGTITNCFAVGTVSSAIFSPFTIGGIVGNIGQGGIYASYYFDGSEGLTGASGPYGQLADGDLPTPNPTYIGTVTSNGASHVSVITNQGAPIVENAFHNEVFYNNGYGLYWSMSSMWDFDNIWTTNGNTGYPTLIEEVESLPAFNPVVNKDPDNYTITLGETNTISSNNHIIVNGMTTVNELISFLTITEGSEYKILSRQDAALVTDYSSFASFTGKNTTQILVNKDVLVVYSGDHTQTIRYTIQSQITGQIINNGKLRFGNGTENSVNSRGGLQQPFYYNNNWYKLTYSTLPLNYAVALNGETTNGWNSGGVVVSDLNLTGLTVDYSGLSYASGTVVAEGTLLVDNKQLKITNRYVLGEDSSFVKITTTVTNLESELVNNVRYWTGTLDDFIAGNDSPYKVKGNLLNGNFVANTENSQQAKALKIESGTDTVLFFSTNATTEMLITGRNMNQLTTTDPRINSNTGSGDQAYAMYINLGNLESGESKSFDWYYAAASAADIGDINSEIGDDVAESGNANLSNLSANQGTLSPVFSSDTLDYTMEVSNAITSIAITPTVADLNSTITVNGVSVVNGQASGNLTLSVGTNVITVIVTAQNSVTKTYTITVTRDQATVIPEVPQTPSTPASIPTTNSRVVSVIGVSELESSQVSTVAVSRTVVGSKKVDEVLLENEKTIEVLRQLEQQNRKTLQIYVDGNNGDPADQINVNIKGKSLELMEVSNVNIELKTDDVKIEIEKDDLSKFRQLQSDLYFRIVPIKSENLKAEAVDQVKAAGIVLAAANSKEVKVLGTPMTIETNYQNFDAYVTFSLSGIEIPEEPSERESFLSNLGMFIHHEDGSQEIQKGTILYDVNGNPVELKVRISNFSTFTFINFEGLASYTYNTNMRLGAIKNKNYAYKVARIFEQEYDTENVKVTKRGNYYYVYADFQNVDVLQNSCNEMIKRKYIINYYIL